MLKFAREFREKKVKWPLALQQLMAYRKEYNFQKIINQNLVQYVTSKLKSEYQVQKIYKKMVTDKVKNVLKTFQKQILEFESVHEINEASTLRTNQDTASFYT